MDVNRVPIVTVIAGTACLVGVIVSVIYVNLGISSTIREWEDVHQFKKISTSYLEDYRLWLAALGFVTICLGLVTVFMNFVKLNSRFTEVPMCTICEGPAAFFTLVALQIVALVIWLYIFRRVSFMRIANKINEKPCKSDGIRAKNATACFNLNETLHSFFPKHRGYNITQCCFGCLQRFCDKYVPEGLETYDTALYCVALLVMSIILLMMSTVSGFSWSKTLDAPPVMRQSVVWNYEESRRLRKSASRVGPKS